MAQPFFIITIDTEGDNLWEKTRDITTKNAAYLARFQALCEKFGFKPTYLTNYEMAQDPVFQTFGRDVLQRKTGEIGTHIHAWNNPPLKPITEDDFVYKTYLIEYPNDVMREKFSTTHHLLEDIFQTPMVSHRSGRWALDSRYVKLLIEFGYQADCSVTPDVDWRSTLGSPNGVGGSDYRAFPKHAYYMDADHIDQPGDSSLLQVPMTTRRKYGALVNTLKKWRADFRHKPYQDSISWLRPRGGNVDAMKKLVRRCLAEPNTDYIEFMLHSSEFMPGGSPTFRTEAHIESLYHDLTILFSWLTSICRGVTLSEYAQHVRRASM